MDIITAWLIEYGVFFAGSTIVTFIIGWIIKKIPFDGIATWAEKIGQKQGKAITKFFNAWKYTKAFYEKIIEPIFIDVINALFLSWVRGFVRGLKSDNSEVLANFNIGDHNVKIKS